MEQFYQVQGFSDEVFTEQACAAYGINPFDLPDFIWATYPWNVFNITPHMVYAFDWAEVVTGEGDKAKAQGLPVIVSGHYSYLGTMRSIFQTSAEKEAA